VAARAGILLALLARDQRPGSTRTACSTATSPRKVHGPPTRLPARAMMADIFDRPPEFTDLTVADEWTG
jgi:hypothetical protein